MKRLLFVAGGGALLAGCASVTNALTENAGVKRVIDSAEALNHAVIGTHGRARLYTEADIDRDFRMNGFDTPGDSAYQAMLRGGFRGYKLAVDGLVEHPQALDIHALRALQSLTQITRHDCVEGWSAIGKWSGVPLGKLLALVQPKPAARYVVFHCFDRSPDNDPYYESLDLVQATHPQTVLALDLNDKPLDADHGAPVRLRIPTQLGYKSAKWISRLELVANFSGTFGGNGGYWEDQGYEWYAGI
jgi:DMSO/TMAO reductase YedYZ molybdopterin-dependent catalytic subunit